MVQERELMKANDVHNQSHLRACHCCGLIHRIPELSAGQGAVCRRCGSWIVRVTAGPGSAARTAATACGALILFLPAVLLPILEIERLGHRHTSSVLVGALELILHGSWFVGGIVLMFSVVFPLAKILLLLELSLLGVMHRRHKALTYRIMEFAGKWSMMDVMLLALLVMLVKLGSLVEFHFGPAVIAFVLCVAMSMLASMFFDPHSIWEDENQDERAESANSAT
jgi:paraquat-inducible protein A